LNELVYTQQAQPSQAYVGSRKQRLTNRKALLGPGNLVLWRKWSQRNSDGITPTRAPHAGGEGKIVFLDRWKSLRLNRLTFENLCPSPSITLVVVEVYL